MGGLSNYTNNVGRGGCGNAFQSGTVKWAPKNCGGEDPRRACPKARQESVRARKRAGALPSRGEEIISKP